MSKHKIHIFYHVAALNGYESIVNEQLNSIKNSGILKHSTFSIGVIGNHKIQTNLTFDIYYFGGIEKYEYPTLHLMWDWFKKMRILMFCIFIQKEFHHQKTNI